MFLTYKCCNCTYKLQPTYCTCNMLGLPGGFARNFNMWGGVGCVNVGVHVYTWYAAGVFMCTHGTLLVCHVQRCYAWGGVGWGVLTFFFICKHGTLLVCHVQTYHAIAVSCLIVHRFLILIGFNVLHIFSIRY